MSNNPQFCKLRRWRGDILARTLAGSTFVQVLIFASPTYGPEKPLYGIILLIVMTILGMVAHYGILTKCDIKNAMDETVIALVFSFFVAIFFAFFWKSSDYSMDILFSLKFFTTPALISWAVGTFTGASLGAVKIEGEDYNKQDKWFK